MELALLLGRDVQHIGSLHLEVQRKLRQIRSTESYHFLVSDFCVLIGYYEIQQLLYLVFSLNGWSCLGCRNFHGLIDCTAIIKQGSCSRLHIFYTSFSSFCELSGNGTN